MANEVRIKLTEEQKEKIKSATGKDMPEIRVESLSTKASARLGAKNTAKLGAKNTAKLGAKNTAKFSAKKPSY